MFYCILPCLLLCSFLILGWWRESIKHIKHHSSLKCYFWFRLWLFCTWVLTTFHLSKTDLHFQNKLVSTVSKLNYEATVCENWFIIKGLWAFLTVAECMLRSNMCLKMTFKGILRATSSHSFLLNWHEYTFLQNVQSNKEWNGNRLANMCTTIYTYGHIFSEIHFGLPYVLKILFVHLLFQGDENTIINLLAESLFLHLFCLFLGRTFDFQIM